MLSALMRVWMIFTATYLEDFMFLARITAPNEPTPKYPWISYPLKNKNTEDMKISNPVRSSL